MAIFSRAFKITYWPLWVKISLGLLAAVLVPLIIGGFIIQSSFASYSLNAEKEVLAQTGKQQIKDISAIISRAQARLTELATGLDLKPQFQ